MYNYYDTMHEYDCNLEPFTIFGSPPPNPYLSNQEIMSSNQSESNSNDFGAFGHSMELKEEKESDKVNGGMNCAQNDEDSFSKKQNNNNASVKASIPKKNISSISPISYKNCKNTNITKKIFTIKKVKKIKKYKKKNPMYWRNDDTKLYWKPKIGQFGQKSLNKAIQESELPVKYKKHIYLPSSKYFTGIATIEFNYHSLSEKVMDIYSKGKEEEPRQNENYEAFTAILNYCNEIGNDHLPESVKKVKDLIEMKYEDLIRMFYDSDYFIDFKEKEKDKIQFHDEGIKLQEGFSLSEDYGLIKLFKKRKRYQLSPTKKISSKKVG